MELQMDQLTMEQRILVHRVLTLQDELKRGDAEFAALKYLIEHELSKPLTLIDRFEFNWQKLFKDAQLLLQNYVVDRLSALEIAEKFSCSKSTILKYLKLNNIPIRESCVPIHKNKDLRYGEKNRGRQRHRHEREQEVIQKMISLREKGLLLSQDRRNSRYDENSHEKPQKQMAGAGRAGDFKATGQRLTYLANIKSKSD